MSEFGSFLKFTLKATGVVMLIVILYIIYRILDGGGV